MSSVTMFSLVQVGPGEDEKFVQFFKEVRAFLSRQPGYITNQLFRSQTPKSSLRFMVVGKWESAEALKAATMNEGWEKVMSGHQMVFSPVPFEEVIVQ